MVSSTTDYEVTVTLRIVFGCIWTTINFLLIPPSIAVIVAICREKNIRQSQCSLIMLCVHIIDFIHLMVDFTAGIWTIYGQGERSETKILCLISIMLGASVFILCCTPLVTVVYNMGSFGWIYIHNDTAYYVAITISLILTPLSLLSFINYVIILVAIQRKKRSVGTQAVSSAEMRILLNSIALFTFMAFSNFFDFFHVYLLPEGQPVFIMLSVIRQICIALIPILALIFNVLVF
ncbi:unnamed protein product [Anisakis simplex]|uniref:G_PROTEIN_RECEP_F1_2 domain-containing protein n=1 Tax=Anisakis simplex TaxID=6269 RepID=A0A0M3K2W3_ANISI|nr:unnamed protein product [Anisakis simplex]